MEAIHHKEFKGYTPARVLHGQAPRSPSPIRPRPSTSVICLANVRHSALCPDCNSSLSKDNRNRGLASTSATSKKYGESPTQSVFYVERKCKYT